MHPQGHWVGDRPCTGPESWDGESTVPSRQRWRRHRGETERESRQSCPLHPGHGAMPELPFWCFLKDLTLHQNTFQNPPLLLLLLLFVSVSVFVFRGRSAGEAALIKNTDKNNDPRAGQAQVGFPAPPLSRWVFLASHFCSLRPFPQL